MRRRFFPYRGRVSGSCRDPDGARRSCNHAATGPVAASDFTSLSGSLSKGPFITGTDGALYGISREGGSSNRGTIYKLTTAGVRTRLVSFTGTRGAAKGQRPRGPLALGPDGTFYGVTERGGAADAGTLFRMKASGTLTVLAEFTAGGPRLPLGGLITGGDGKFYGTTSVGGVVAAGPNLLYGVAPAGGPGGGGVAFRLTLGSAQSPFSQWRQSFAGDAAAPMLADPDADGVPLLMEYALGLLPTVHDAATMPAASLYSDPSGEVRLRLILTRNPARSDVTITVQAASDPAGPWDPLATSVMGAPFSGTGYLSGDAATPGLKTIEIRDTATYSSTPRRFLRIKVTF